MKNRTWWIFTFGYGQPNAGCYIRVYGTYAEARNFMFEKFGKEWGFQYDEEEYDKFFENKKWIKKEEYIGEFIVGR